MSTKETYLWHHFDDLEQQHEATSLGMWTFLATEVLIFGGLLLTGLSILVTCTIAYRNFYVAIDSSDHLRKVAVSTADTVDMLILENIQFVRSIASDPMVIAKAEWAAKEAGQRAAFQNFEAGWMGRGSPRAAAMAPALREGEAEVLQPTVE